MTQTLFLGVATVLVALGSFLASIRHDYTAYGFFVGAVIMVGFAVWAAYLEGVPKPHLMPVGYGKTPDQRGPAGLVFFNDGDPAYNIEPPKETKISEGSATLLFEDPPLSAPQQGWRHPMFPHQGKVFRRRDCLWRSTNRAYSVAWRKCISFLPLR